jgi:hypothetical protein
MTQCRQRLEFNETDQTLHYQDAHYLLMIVKFVQKASLSKREVCPGAYRNHRVCLS